MRGAINSQSSPYLASRPIALGLAKVLFLSFSQLPMISAIPTPTPLTAFSHHGLWPANQDIGPEPKPADDPSLWLYLSVAIALVLGGGAFAGLTIALMGQV
jgi:metal transporter CNNM